MYAVVFLEILLALEKQLDSVTIQAAQGVTKPGR